MSELDYSQKAVIFALLGRIFIAELDRESLQALQEQQISSVLEKLQTGCKSYLMNTQWNEQQIELLASEYCHLFILPKKSGLSLKASHWLTNDEASHLAQLETIISNLDTSLINNYDAGNLPGDHLGVLLYFLSAVYSSDDKEIQKQGDPLATISLLPWIVRFNEKLSQSSSNPLYLASGKLLLQILDYKEH